jgi:hypothetical protein
MLINKQHNLAPALQWAQEHRPNLPAYGGMEFAPKHVADQEWQ